jgi:hypothetical protein
MASQLTLSLPLDQFEDEKLNKIVVKNFSAKDFLLLPKTALEVYY